VQQSDGQNATANPLSIMTRLLARVEQLAQRPSQCDVLIERPGGEARIENGQFAPDRANLTIINACADTGCQRLPCRLTQAAEEEVK
jgi:hypothetical protein